MLGLATPLHGRRNNLPGMVKKQPLTKIVAGNLRALMETHQDLNSTRKLEEKSGVSHKTISNILSERHNVLVVNLEKIAKAFRIEPVSLLCSPADYKLLGICKVYSDADQRGRDLLADTAETVKRRIGAATAGGVSKPGSSEQ